MTVLAGLSLMKLTLNHAQRLKLHALLVAQRTDVGTIRAIWAVQDKLALDADEENAIELKREMVGDQERVVWNAGLFLSPKELEFSPSESARIRSVLQTWESFAAAPTGAGCSRWSTRYSPPTSDKARIDAKVRSKAGSNGADVGREGRSAAPTTYETVARHGGNARK